MITKEFDDKTSMNERRGNTFGVLRNHRGKIGDHLAEQYQESLKKYVTGTAERV